MAASDNLIAVNSEVRRLYDAGDYRAATPLAERAIQRLEPGGGPDDPNFGTAFNNLAMLYHIQGRYTKAEPLYTRALRIWEKTLGPEAPHVSNALNNLAGLYHAQGRF